MSYQKLLFYFFIVFSSGKAAKGSIKEPHFLNSHISCGRDFIQLDVKLNPEIWRRVQTKLEMHLIDKYCKPFYVNSTHVFIRTSLYDCGTKLEVTKDHVIFTNAFIVSEKPEAGKLVAFLPDVEVEFRCTYDRKSVTRKNAPLQLDKLHSSPRKVTTFNGLPVVLKCAFKYGTPPVHVVILRDGKIVANQENGTQTAKIIVGRTRKEFGLYTCLAEDAMSVKITQGMQLMKVDPSSISPDGKQVTCTHNEMYLTLNHLVFPWLRPQYFDMSLLDNRCRPYHVNITHVVVKTGYGDCKTRQENSSHEVIYKNVLMALARPIPGTIITRVPDVLFPFECRLNHTNKALGLLKEESVPAEPLTADKSKSTPSVVKTYKGFTVRLMCTFKGGVLPITVKLTRGKRLAESVEVKGRTLYFTLKTDRMASFRSYECVATDRKRKRVKQRITLQKAGPRDFVSDGMKVTCKSDHMDVRLSRLVYPWLDPDLLRINLVQSSCTGYNITDMEVRIQAPLSRCGTATLRKSKYVLTSRNTIITRPKFLGGVIVSYLPHIHFSIACDYEITRSDGRTVLKPIEPLMPDVSESSSNTVFSPPRMAIKLKCIFQGGEPPIRVSISRHKVVIAHAQGRMLSFVIIEPHIYDDGRYVCRAIDARNKTVTHKINLHVPVKGAVWNKGTNVNCSSKFTTVTMLRANFPWLDTERMDVHLSDPACRGNINGTHVSFKFQRGGCGSKHIETSRRLIFSNTVFIVNKPYYEERKVKSVLEIHFYCKYRRMDGRNRKITGFL